MLKSRHCHTLAGPITDHPRGIIKKIKCLTVALDLRLDGNSVQFVFTSKEFSTDTRKLSPHFPYIERGQGRGHHSVLLMGCRPTKRTTSTFPSVVPQWDRDGQSENAPSGPPTLWVNLDSRGPSGDALGKAEQQTPVNKSGRKQKGNKKGEQKSPAVRSLRLSSSHATYQVGRGGIALVGQR